MTSEQTERLKELCHKVQTETDRHKFKQLVLELSVLLEQRSNDLANTGLSVGPSAVES